MYKIPDRRKRIDEIVDLFYLSKLMDSIIGTLSAGEIARLNLAKAFINHPKIVLLDEPTASLDPEVAYSMRHFIRERSKKFGLSVLFTSHNMSEVEDLCERVIFINNGKITANDAPANLARSLNSCNVSLVIEENSQNVFLKIVGSDYSFKKNEGKEIRLSMKESEVPGFLQKLVNSGVVYYGLTVSRPTLERYFLHQSISGTK